MLVHLLSAQVFTDGWTQELIWNHAENQISPSQITVNMFGDIYILDDNNYSIHYFPKNGSESNESGGWGDEGETFIFATDLAISGGNDVYICDYGSNRIIRFDRKLNYISEFHTDHFDIDPIFFPIKIAINPLGEIVVVSSQQWDVSLISTTGVVLFTTGNIPFANSRFKKISDCSVNPANQIGVIDRGMGQFIILSRNGQIDYRLSLPDDQNYFVHWWRNSWLILSQTGMLWVVKPEFVEFSEILNANRLDQTYEFIDFTIHKNSIYAIDQLSGKIYSNQLRTVD